MRCAICCAGDVVVDPCFFFEFAQVQLSDDGDVSAEAAGLDYYLRHLCGEDDGASKKVHKVYQTKWCHVGHGWCLNMAFCAGYVCFPA